jgi:hypothetical protein
MRVGLKRIELARILTEITGLSYSPNCIKQANRTQDRRKMTNYDAYYWYALPDKHGAVLSSRYTMSQIIDAYNNGKTVICDDGVISIGERLPK